MVVMMVVTVLLILLLVLLLLVVVVLLLRILRWMNPGRQRLALVAVTSVGMSFRALSLGSTVVAFMRVRGEHLAEYLDIQPWKFQVPILISTLY